MQPEIEFLRGHTSCGSMKQQLVAKLGVGGGSHHGAPRLWLRGCAIMFCEEVFLRVKNTHTCAGNFLESVIAPPYPDIYMYSALAWCRPDVYIAKYESTCRF